jgi:hypothetical protein
MLLNTFWIVDGNSMAIADSPILLGPVPRAPNSYVISSAPETLGLGFDKIELKLDFSIGKQENR